MLSPGLFVAGLVAVVIGILSFVVGVRQKPSPQVNEDFSNEAKGCLLIMFSWGALAIGIVLALIAVILWFCGY